MPAAILITYHGPTNTLPSRLKVRRADYRKDDPEAFKPITIGYDDVHYYAANPDSEHYDLAAECQGDRIMFALRLYLAQCGWGGKWAYGTGKGATWYCVPVMEWNSVDVG